MIKVTVELMSALSSDNDRVLGVMYLANDGTGTDQVCHYDGRVMRKPDFIVVTKKGRVVNHRRHALTIWHLVFKMLHSMGYSK